MKQDCSILLVEDDADDVYFIQRALREKAVSTPVHVVHDGQSAIDFLSQASEQVVVDDAPGLGLVLLDLNLPIKSGLEVLKWIRRESRWKTIVVVVLTSSTSEDDLHDAYALGANAYVIKPADPTQLRDLAQFVNGFWLTWNQPPPLRKLLTGAR